MIVTGCGLGWARQLHGGVVWPHTACPGQIWSNMPLIYVCSSALDVRCAVCKIVIEPLFAISDGSQVHVRVRPCFWVFWMIQNTYLSRGIGG